MPNESYILNDAEIIQSLCEKEMIISPIIDTDQISTTVDLRLGTEFYVKSMDKLPFFDVLMFHDSHRDGKRVADRYNHRVRNFRIDDPFYLHPGQLALGCTLEYVELPSTIGALLEGRSSWAREGLNVHTTAGFIHPGHKGVIVLELYNSGSHALPLFPGMRVAQLLPYRLAGSNGSYSDDRRYHGMTGTTYGLPWKDWEFGAISELREVSK